MARETVSNIEAHWEWELTKVIAKVIALYGDKGFTSDEIWKHCAIDAPDLPPTYIARKVGALLKSVKASGRIRKNGSCRLSTRNGSSTLPVYVRRRDV